MGEVDGAEIMKRSHQSAGFTLVEVVVAITLMSLVMLTLVMGLRIAANAWHRGEQKLDDHARVLSGTDVVAQQISAAAVRIVTDTRGVDNIPVRVVAFFGSSSELRFATRRSWRGERSRPQYMADYRVTDGAPGKQRLVVNEWGVTDDSSVLLALQVRAPENGQAIGDPADRIELAYLQPATALQAAQWVSNWQPQTDAELPQAVRVRWTRGNEVQQTIFPVAINHVVRGR
jgi:general secretion pathway protein J